MGTASAPNNPRLPRITGWFYLLIIVSSLLSLIFLGGKYTVMGDSAASVTRMAQYSTHVRINAAYEVFMFSAVIVLAVLLFELTKGINRTLAGCALYLRVAEAILGYIGIVLSLGVLTISGGITNPENTGSLAVLLYDLKDIVYKVLMVCISLGTVIFFSLFYKARLVPAVLSIWGITGFGLMIIASIFQILSAPGGIVINGIAAALAISFELVIGIWLIVKGTRVPDQRNDERLLHRRTINE